MSLATCLLLLLLLLACMSLLRMLLLMLKLLMFSFLPGCLALLLSLCWSAREYRGASTPPASSTPACTPTPSAVTTCRHNRASIYHALLHLY
jgi:hypothetical protein